MSTDLDGISEKEEINKDVPKDNINNDFNAKLLDENESFEKRREERRKKGRNKK